MAVLRYDTANFAGAKFASDGSGYVLIGRDFLNYWIGAKLTLSGEMGILFDENAYYLRLQQEFGNTLSFHNWSYPPHTLLLIFRLVFYHICGLI